MIRFRLLLFLAITLLFSYCQTQPAFLADTIKYHPNDPFNRTMAESLFFDSNADTGQVMEGRQGIRIVLPEGCFIDKNGQKVTGKVRTELAGALQLSNMVLSNLSPFPMAICGKPTLMNSFEQLSDEDIDAIWKYAAHRN
jgi:hypothetical protein